MDLALFEVPPVADEIPLLPGQRVVVSRLT